MPWSCGETKRSREEEAVVVLVRAGSRRIGKIACARNFHCVRACDSKAFYRVLVQLK